MQRTSFFHERDPHGFRARFRELLARSTHLDTAVTRLRLTTLDLSDSELARIESVRLVVAELRAVELDAEAHALVARPGAGPRLQRLRSLLDRNVVQMRVVPLAGWSPDFSLFRSGSVPLGMLMGFHAFERPHPYSGPALGAEFGPSETAELSRRFDEVWDRGHDVVDAVRTVLDRAHRWHPRQRRPRTRVHRRSQAVDSIPGLG